MPVWGSYLHLMQGFGGGGLGVAGVGDISSGGRAEPVWYSWWVRPMLLRLLMIGLLLSLAALLIVAAGVARHILLQRRKHRSEAQAAIGAAHETDVEAEP